MVRINKIYTKTGDTGSTFLVGGKKTKKNSLRVASYGEVDELNAFLGWARTLAESEARKSFVSELEFLQNRLFDIGAELATLPEDLTKQSVTENDIEKLEKWIDAHTGDLPELRSFVLPGTTELNAAFHICRTICRRVERTLVTLHEQEPLRKPVIPFFNRLSDLLFAMARAEAKTAGKDEYLWKPTEG